MSATDKLAALARGHPEWQPWLHVVGDLLAELREPVWSSPAPHLAPAAPHRPLLAGAVLRPDADAVLRWFDRLVQQARGQGLHAMCGADARPPSADEAFSIWLAALNGDDAALAAHAQRVGAGVEGFAALAQLLPMPHLHACAAALAADVAGHDTAGWCPVCGAWPAFAEVLGVERRRHLRCGRCGAAWPTPGLSCAYCGNADHARLGTLLVDERASRCTVDVCHACTGYLKCYTTLQPAPADEVLVADLASVEFDVAAVERGHRRPPGLAVPLQARLQGRDPRGSAA